MDGFFQEFSRDLKSLKKIGSVLAGLAGDHLELAMLELREEKIHLISMVVSIGIGVSFFISSMISLTGLIIFFLPPGQRLFGLALITVLFFGGGVLFLFLAARRFRRLPHPFHETIREIKKDLECF